MHCIGSARHLLCLDSQKPTKPEDNGLYLL
jgi:hypothetical protein